MIASYGEAKVGAATRRARVDHRDHSLGARQNHQAKHVIDEDVASTLRTRDLVDRLDAQFSEGFDGMNFHNMPELGWRHSYFGVLSAMVAIAATMLRGFSRAGWFR